LLFMFCHGSEEKWILNVNFFKSLISSDNMTINIEDNDRLKYYQWSDIVSKILKIDNDNSFAIIIAKQIIEFCSQPKMNLSLDTYLSKISKILFDKYFEIVWLYFGDGIIGEYNTFFHLKYIIGSKQDFYESKIGIVFSCSEKNERILEWCRQNVDKAPERIALMMPLDIVVGDVISWHPFSKAIIDEFGDNKNLLSHLSSNMETFGSIGSSIPHYNTQKILLEKLIYHEIPRVKEWAIDMLEYTKKSIKREQLNDEQLFLT